MVDRYFPLLTEQRKKPNMIVIVHWIGQTFGRSQLCPHSPISVPLQTREMGTPVVHLRVDCVIGTRYLHDDRPSCSCNLDGDADQMLRQVDLLRQAWIDDQPTMVPMDSTIRLNYPGVSFRCFGRVDWQTFAEEVRRKAGGNPGISYISVAFGSSPFPVLSTAGSSSRGQSPAASSIVANTEDHHGDDMQFEVAAPAPSLPSGSVRAPSPSLSIVPTESRSHMARQTPTPQFAVPSPVEPLPVEVNAPAPDNVSVATASSTTGGGRGLKRPARSKEAITYDDDEEKSNGGSSRKSARRSTAGRVSYKEPVISDEEEDEPDDGEEEDEDSDAFSDASSDELSIHPDSDDDEARDEEPSFGESDEEDVKPQVRQRPVTKPSVAAIASSSSSSHAPSVLSSSGAGRPNQAKKRGNASPPPNGMVKFTKHVVESRFPEFRDAEKPPRAQVRRFMRDVILKEYVESITKDAPRIKRCVYLYAGAGPDQPNEDGFWAFFNGDVGRDLLSKDKTGAGAVLRGWDPSLRG